ncbi:hypothetical protein G7084_04090 [Weissella coleopterorum]|uniref:Uncharacterized protein n=1 Tax=Weissella coleopterorum TaxID=2714949 RepID=A0A6G8AZS4_9LACO|nr:hypothetical protein G7084_04090 [Weissella coleopterorum]
MSKKYGRISAIDLYVATKVLDDDISMKDLLDVVSVLLKYDWDYANEKAPMFYWKQISKQDSKDCSNNADSTSDDKNKQ